MSGATECSPATLWDPTIAFGFDLLLQIASRVNGAPRVVEICLQGSLEASQSQGLCYAVWLGVYLNVINTRCPV